MNQRLKQTIDDNKSCYSCYYFHKSITRYDDDYQCMNPGARKELKKRGYDSIPDAVLIHGCSFYLHKNNKPEKEVKEEKEDKQTKFF